MVSGRGPDTLAAAAGAARRRSIHCPTCRASRFTARPRYLAGRLAEALRAQDHEGDQEQIGNYDLDVAPEVVADAGLYETEEQPREDRAVIIAEPAQGDDDECQNGERVGRRRRERQDQ